MHTYQYTFLENELDNGAVNPENKCFCRKGHCLKSGLIDVTDCYYGKIIYYLFNVFVRLFLYKLKVIIIITKKRDINLLQHELSANKLVLSTTFKLIYIYFIITKHGT